VSRRTTRSTTTPKAFHVLWIRAEVGWEAFYAPDQALAVECLVERFLFVARWVCLPVSLALHKGLMDKLAEKLPGVLPGLESEGFERSDGDFQVRRAFSAVGAKLKCHGSGATPDLTPR